MRPKGDEENNKKKLSNLFGTEKSFPVFKMWKKMNEGEVEMLKKKNFLKRKKKKEEKNIQQDLKTCSQSSGNQNGRP